MMPFKTRQMIGPVLPRPSQQGRMLHLQPDILEIIPESRSGQTLYIFKYESLGADLPDRADRLRKHVSGIIMGAMLATQRERLTGGATGNKINLAFMGTEINGSDIALDQRPMTNCRNAAFLIFADCFAAVVIPFNDLRRGKSSLMQSYPQTTRSRKKLN